MNAFLAQLFAFLNAVVGFLIVAVGVLVGYAVLTDRTINGFSFGQAAPLAIAAVIGAVVMAVLLCGLIALLAEIERHLREMKEENIWRLKQLRDTDSKEEPSV